jgi:hypothetical protein
MSRVVHFLVDIRKEGETRGVNMAEKVLRGTLDSKSRDLAGEILHKDRSSIDKLNRLL